MKKQSFFLKLKLSLFATAVLFSASTQAQAPLIEAENDPAINMSCTSIMVGKQASTDGSVMTSHTCDAWSGHLYRTWLDIVPAQKGDTVKMMDIYDGLLYSRSKEDLGTLTVKGQIPTVPNTFSFLNTSYPCFNEKQLGIGETSINGKSELKSNNGIFLVEELEHIVLQRCSTARDAIKMIGQLIKEYGYIDGGECLTIADKKEVWMIEMFGEGKGKKGGVWAAARIPDDHVGVSANITRIAELDLKKKDMYMASDNVYSVAKELNLWDGKEPFKFWKVYGGKKAFSIREFFIFKTLAPSLALDYDAEELPLYIKPEAKVAPQQVMELLRSTYEGTEWDPVKNLTIEVQKKDGEKEMVVSPYANPWMRNMSTLFNTLKPGTVDRYRTISVPQCSYSHVIQLRDWLPDAVGGIVWLSFDNPGQSPRIPIFAGSKTLPREFSVCGQHRFTRDAAVWPFRRANKLSSVKWQENGYMIKDAIAQYEARGFNDLPALEKEAVKIYNEKGAEACGEFLSQYTNDFFNSAAKKWWDMGDDLWMKYVMGF